MRIRVIACGLLFDTAQQVFAADNSKAAVEAVDKDDFARIVANLHAEMGPEGRYAEVKPDERRRIDRDLGKMDEIFARSGDVAHMTQDERVAFFNAQEEINGVLLKRDNQRLICIHQVRTGTHMPLTTCNTAYDLQRYGENSRDFMQTMVQGKAMGSKDVAHNSIQPFPHK